MVSLVDSLQRLANNLLAQQILHIGCISVEHLVSGCKSCFSQSTGPMELERGYCCGAACAACSSSPACQMPQARQNITCRLTIAETGGVMQQATALLELQPFNLHASCEHRTAASAGSVQALVQQGNAEH